LKKLYIIRHAKSSWSDMSLGDFDRPLNKRGKRDAPFMAQKLKEKKVLPDVIVSSPAKRTKSTAQIFANEINFTKPIAYDKNIYEADGGELKYVVNSLNDKAKTALMFGHNPGLNMLAENFLEFNENIPTCGIIEIEFDCKKWSEISSKNAKLISFDYPKKHNL